MLVRHLLYLLGCMSLSSAIFPASYTGTWWQVYSTAYIQYTTEIDWHCVRVDISSVDQSTFVLSKTVSLHGGDVQMTTPLKLLSATTTGEWYIGGEGFISRYESQDLILLTGMNNFSLYVWSRDYHAFQGSEEEKNVLRDLKTWGFDKDYKKPLRCPCRLLE